MLLALTAMATASACQRGSTGTNPAPPVSSTPSTSSTLPESSKLNAESDAGEPEPWRALLGEMPGLTAYERYSSVAMPLWMTMSQPDSLWIDTDVGCVPLEGLTLDRGELRGSLEICRRDLEPGHARCTRDLRIGTSMVIENSVFCEARRGDSGVGMGSGSSRRLIQAQLITGDKNRALYAPVWEIQLVADAVVLVEQPCLPGSVDRARAGFRRDHPEASDDEMSVALWEQNGIRDDRRACLISRGVRPELRPLGPLHSHGLRGKGVKREVRSEPADCADPCPADPENQRMQSHNPVLSRYRLVEPDAPRHGVYRTRSACEGDIDDRPLPLDADEACHGDWLRDLEQD